LCDEAISIYKSFTYFNGDRGKNRLAMTSNDLSNYFEKPSLILVNPAAPESISLIIKRHFLSNQPTGTAY
jgi:hypothetical protein